MLVLKLLFFNIVFNMKITFTSAKACPVSTPFKCKVFPAIFTIKDLPWVL